MMFLMRNIYKPYGRKLEVCRRKFEPWWKYLPLLHLTGVRWSDFFSSFLSIPPSFSSSSSLWNRYFFSLTKCKDLLNNCKHVKLVKYPNYPKAKHKKATVKKFIACFMDSSCEASSWAARSGISDALMNKIWFIKKTENQCIVGKLIFFFLQNTLTYVCFWMHWGFSVLLRTKAELHI